MGGCHSKKTVGWGSITESLILDDYDSAGVAFITNTHMLVGYQPHKAQSSLTGIGGKREEGETYLQTALREAVEELFHVSHVNPHLIFRLAKACKPITTIVQNGYVIVVYDFHTLDIFLQTVANSNIDTLLYDEFPRNWSDLILNRRVHPMAEISHLALLPLIHHNGSVPFVHHECIIDLALIKAAIST